jgi:RimJ/RimL family protein N-acetyltransferase
MQEFKLRPWRLEDLGSLVHHANNWNIAKNLTDAFPHPYTEESGRAFIAMATKDDLTRIFAIEVDGQAVGGIGIHPQSDIHRMNAEMGYWLAEPYWGRQIMRRAVRQMVEYGFQHFELDRIFARPFGTNIGSQRVLESAGMQFEAHFTKTLYKSGEYLDEIFYGIRRADVVQQ